MNFNCEEKRHSLKEGSYVDSEGFLRMPDGCYFDESGVFFNNKGDDCFGGYYNKYGCYVDGKNNGFGVVSDDDITRNELDEMNYIEEIGESENYLDDLEEQFEDFKSKSQYLLRRTTEGNSFKVNGK